MQELEEGKKSLWMGTVGIVGVGRGRRTQKTTVCSKARYNRQEEKKSLGRV